ncbi:RadC family protein [Paenibacillus thermotolerans]|uniref:RadC family protein n=1 Tax=Paenibacillus thermotolerans TaxID=3027807 RepID=UPI0023683364|nr:MULTISPECIES: DNA repair protein RadC [unclassified Paenibacillus]
MSISNIMLRELPAEDRPRERMAAHGAGSVSNSELLAILLRTGTRNEPATALAARVLKECGGLRGLVDMSVDQLRQMRGIGTAKALQIHAALELGRRLARSVQEETPAIRSPQDVARLVTEELRYLKQEHFVCLFLNTKNHVIGKETLSVGSLNSAIVHPRELFRAAIKRSAAAVICVHNHPSGDPTPSKEDIELTNRLSEAGSIIGIDVLDHVVIGDNRYVSLKEQGHL